MKRLVLFATALIAASCTTTAQDSQAKPVCDKLPYRLGHLVTLNTTDLRDSPRSITRKETKELSKKQGQVRRECDAFVSKNPGHPVSMVTCPPEISPAEM